MSNSVDKRVVEMQFDNKQFETNVQQSVDSLDKLKKSLDLEESAKGLQSVEKTINLIDFSRLADAAETVANRFSFLGTVVNSFYNRIANVLIDLTQKGAAFVKSLTIDPISTGFAEYETQINAIQTIMSNTRDSMKEQGITDESERLELVNEKLDELNHYADKTIYNFTEMTRNIGTFTAAGVDLNTATSAIQGIANLAAVSGSTSQQASTAMYQLSQAISTGTVKLMDWNSVVNAGMGGELFQKALTRTADRMGKGASALITEAGSFRESLSSGWLTSDVLTATLEQMSWDFEAEAKKIEGYTEENKEQFIEMAKESHRAQLLADGYSVDEVEEILQLAEDATDAATKVKTFTQLFDTLKEAAQSGWTETWEYIIGDFEEAKALLTDISDFFGKIIDENSTARNKIMAEWKEGGGRDDLIEGFWNVVYAIQNVVQMISGEFEKVFPKVTATNLLNITEAFKTLTAKIKEFTADEDKMEKFRRIVAGIANALDIIRQVIVALWNGAKSLISYLIPEGSGLLELIAKGADKITEFNQHLKETGGITNVVQKIVDVIKKMIDGVRGFVQAAKDLFANGPQGILGSLKEWFGQFSNIGDKISQFFDGNSILSSIKNFFSNIVSGITGFAENMDGADIAVIIGSLFGASLVLKIRKFIKNLNKVRESLCEGISKVAEDLGDTLASFGKKGDITKSILQLAASLALIAVALYIVAQIDPDSLGSAMLAVTLMLGVLTAFAFVVSKIIKGKSAVSLAATCTGLLILGAAMLMFAGVVEKLGKLDDDALVKGIAGMGAVLLELVVFLALTKKAKMGISKGAGLVLLAVSLRLFADAIAAIGVLDTKTIAKGVAGLGVIFLELAAFLALTKKAKMGISKGVGLILLAESIKMFAETIAVLGAMDTNAMLKGIGGLGLVLLELVVFLALTKKSSFGMFDGVGLILLAESVKMFAETVATFGDMETDTMVRGLAGLGAVLLELGIFLKLAKNTNFGVFKGAAMILLAVSIKMFAESIAVLGVMDTDTMIRGLAGMGAVLSELAIFLALTKKAKFGVFKGAAMILLAVSINLFARAIEKIGSLDTDTIVQGLVGMGLVMLELAIFLALTKKAKFGVFKGAAMIMLAVSINLFGDAIARIGRLKTSTIIKGIAGLGLVLLELSLFMKSMSKTKSSGILKSLVMLGVMAVSMQIFAKVLKHLEGVELDTMIGFSASFGVALLSLSAAMLLISKVPFSAAILGIAKLGLIAAGIVALMAAFGAAEQAWSVSSYIQSFGDLAESIGNAIGRFVGGLGNGIITGLDLPTVGSELSTFMTNLQPFLDGCKNVDESVVSGVGYLSLALLAISGSEFVTAITSWFVGDNPISKFADDLGIIATALNNFASNLSGFTSTDETTITSATTAAKGLAELVKAVPWELPQWAQAIAGKQNVESFANDTGTLATALMNYATNISGFTTTVSEEDVTNSTNAALALVALQKALPAEEGWIQKLTGIKDLSTFGERVPGFAAGMKAYAAEISGFTDSVSQEDMDNSNNAAEALINLENSLSRQNGSLQDLIGIKDLSGFATKLPGFAAGMKAYAAEITGFTDSVSAVDMENANNAAEALINLENSLARQNGSLQNLIGVKDLSSFAEKVPGFASGMKAYAQNISGFTDTVNETDITNSTNAAKGLVELQKTLPSEGGWLDGITGVKDLTSFAEKVPGFASGMKAYAQNISGFTDAVSETDITNSTNAAKGLAELEGSLINTDGLWQKISGVQDLSDFATKLPGFATGMKAYAENISGFTNTVNESDITNSTAAAKGLAELEGSLTNTDGLWQKISGVPDLSDFATKLPGFATGMKAYAENLANFSSTVSEDDISSSTNAAKGLVELESSLKNTDGVWQSITGVPDLSDFAAKIPGFASGMKAYAENIANFSSTVSEADVTNSTNAAQALIGLENSLSNTGGLWQGITGIPDLGSFAERVPLFATGMKAYAAEISGFTSTVTQEDIDNSTNTATALAALESSLTGQNGWVQGICGQKDLGDFGTNCEKLGEGLASFATNIGGVEFTNTDAAIAAMQLITEFSKSMNSEGGLLNLIGSMIGGEQDVVGLSEKMAAVGTNLAAFATNINGADFSNTEQATQVMTDMQTFVNSLDVEGGVWSDIGEFFGGSKDIVKVSSQMASFGSNFNAFANGITGAAAAATDFGSVKTIVESFIEISKGIKEGEIDTWDLEEAGYLLASSFTTSMMGAITDTTTEFSTTITMLTENGRTAANNTATNWRRTGKNLSKGLAGGITSMAQTVKNAAIGVADGAIRSIQICWSVHSPSRVGRDLGMYFDQGIAGGLSSYSKVVSDSAAEMGQNAVESASTMLRGVDGSVFDYIDPNPTIRPVLDLSNVENGVQTIGGMLNSEQIVSSGLFQGMNFSRGVNTLTFDGAKITGGLTDRNIVDKLESLSGRISELGEAVSNMKLVLDTGVLVGETSAQMDAQLGTLAMRRGRGN